MIRGYEDAINQSFNYTCVTMDIISVQHSSHLSIVGRGLGTYAEPLQAVEGAPSNRPRCPGSFEEQQITEPTLIPNHKPLKRNPKTHKLFPKLSPNPQSEEQPCRLSRQLQAAAYNPNPTIRNPQPQISLLAPETRCSHLRIGTRPSLIGCSSSPTETL